ncbi:MAG: hypothetical protein ACXWUL_06380, partial [Caldimonas sp.]
MDLRATSVLDRMDRKSDDRADLANARGAGWASMRAASAHDFNAKVAAGEPQAAPAPTEAEVGRLFANVAATTGAGVLVALCLWLLLDRSGSSAPARGWAIAIHATQAASLGLLWAFRRASRTRAAAPIVWLRRFRVVLAVAAAVWGLAPVLFLPADDLALAAVVMVVLLAIAVGGTAAVATDRASIYLWLLPVSLPLPLVLAWYGGRGYLVLAGVAVAFAAVQ